MKNSHAINQSSHFLMWDWTMILDISYISHMYEQYLKRFSLACHRSVSGFQKFPRVKGPYFPELPVVSSWGEDRNSSLISGNGVSAATEFARSKNFHIELNFTTVKSSSMVFSAQTLSELLRRYIYTNDFMIIWHPLRQ